MENQPVPQMNDVGTRYDHLRDFADSLNECAKRIQDRGMKTSKDQEKFIKFTVAAEVISTALDAQLGVADATNDFKLYKLVDSIPKAETIEGGRGTDLAKPFVPNIPPEVTSQ